MKFPTFPRFPRGEFSPSEAGDFLPHRQNGIKAIQHRMPCCSCLKDKSSFNGCSAGKLMELMHMEICMCIYTIILVSTYRYKK